MVAIRTVRLLGAIAKVVAAAIVAICVTAAVFRPAAVAFPEALQTWFVPLAIGIPVLFGLEMLGTWALSRPFLETRSSGARIAIIVCAVVALVAALFGVVQVAKAYAP